MVRPFTEDKQESIHRLVGQGITEPDEVTRLLKLGHYGVSYVAKVIEQIIAGQTTSVAPDGPKASATPTVDETADRIAKHREMQRERDALMAIAGEKSFRSYLEAVMRDVAPTLSPLPPMRNPTPDPSASRETMLTIWSDWHAFETVSFDRTMGFNEFNSRILCERVRRDVLARLEIKDRLERGGGWALPNLVIACNGDFVSGTIHELERHSDAKHVIDAVFKTGMLLAAAIRDLSPHFHQIDVYCTSGNHGRLPDARRMQQKDPTRNWDSAIYLYAATALAGIPNVRFHIPDSYMVAYRVEGWQFLQYHGHDIKQQFSIPYYGIDRFGRNFQSLFNSRSDRIDFILISHFHSASTIPAPGAETIINGSLIGGNEFVLTALGKSDKPSQWMMLVHPEHGITSRWPIYSVGEKPVDPYPLPDWNKVA